MDSNDVQRTTEMPQSLDGPTRVTATPEETLPKVPVPQSKNPKRVAAGKAGAAARKANRQHLLSELKAAKEALHATSSPPQVHSPPPPQVRRSPSPPPTTGNGWTPILVGGGFAALVLAWAWKQGALATESPEPCLPTTSPEPQQFNSHPDPFYME